jgi:hypothetical protein
MLKHEVILTWRAILGQIVAVFYVMLLTTAEEALRESIPVSCIADLQ